jgi:predicted nucleic acid-binding protein
VSLALDTNVLIPWLVASAPGHLAASALVAGEIRRPGGQIVLAQQVVWEFLHVATDAGRFTSPLSMDAARNLLLPVWQAAETSRVVPTPEVVPRVLELMAKHQLGRKRILDAALAATLERAGVRRLATLNGADVQCFPFIEVVEPA